VRLLYVPLGDAALQQLHERALAERRRPQDEAAVLLERALGLRDAPALDSIAGRSLAESPRARCTEEPR